MAVESIREIWRGRDADGQLDDTRYTRVFRIWTTSGADDATVVGAALALPPWNIFPGAVHPNDPRAFCVGARPQNDLGPKGWICAATFSTKRELAQDPTDDDIEISFDEEDIDVPVIKDRDGEAVLNSAGDYPSEPIMAQDSILICKIDLNVAAWPSYLRAYRKTINQDQFKIEDLTIDAKHARVRRISIGKKRYRASNAYRSLSIELAILDNDEDDWEIRFLDQGYRRKTGAGKLETITLDGDGTEPTTPVLLDGSGDVLASPTPATAVFREAKFYRLQNFVGVIPGCVSP
jgi:hypothetical protein